MEVSTTLVELKRGDLSRLMAEGRQLNVRSWLKAEVRTMPLVGPVYPQEQTFWARLGMSQIDPLETFNGSCCSTGGGRKLGVPAPSVTIRLARSGGLPRRLPPRRNPMH